MDELEKLKQDVAERNGKIQLLSQNIKKLETQKEIEKYFTESTGFGRDKIRNFMDIVNKALKQKGERIAELEEENAKIKQLLLLAHNSIFKYESNNSFCITIYAQGNKDVFGKWLKDVTKILKKEEKKNG